MEKQAERGYRGYPCHGGVLRTGSFPRQQVAVGNRPSQAKTASVLERWFSETEDVGTTKPSLRRCKFIEKHGVKSVAIASSIIGCPHEEGPDYPVGEVLPVCPYWQPRSLDGGGVAVQ